MEKMIVNFYATLRELPELSFPHELNSRRDRSDPSLAEHLAGFAGYIWQGAGRTMTANVYHLLQHVRRVRHQLSATVDTDDLESMCAWAARANAVLFYQDGSVRDDQGHPLVDGSGAPPHPEDADWDDVDSPT